MDTSENASRQAWKRVAYTNLLQPKREFKCPFCGGRMNPANGHVFSFSIRPDEKVESFAMDVWQLCERCGYANVHGAPLSKREYDRLCLHVRAVVAKDEKTEGEGQYVIL